jgi:hypothetical protein
VSLGAQLCGKGRRAVRLPRPVAMRRPAAVLLALLLALPVGDVRSAQASGTIQGVVRLEGQPRSGVTVAFIELKSGSVVRAMSSDTGTFSVAAPVGEYAVTTESQVGLTVGHAPVRVAVTEGKTASADVDLVAVASAVVQEPAAPAETPSTQQPPAQPEATPPPAPGAQAPAVWAETSGTGAQILFEPVTCFVAGEFPLLDADIEPVASVARARIYFKGSVGEAFYYVEMGQEQGRYFGKLPRPRVEASPITYYVQSTTTQFEESQTREIEAIVVKDKGECGDRRIAAFGPPGAITIFSATTGVSILAPAGFAAVAASGLAVGAVTVLAAGAAAAGIVGGVVVGPGGGGTVTPPPINPTAIPIPTPTPLPTPTPITTSQ